MMPQTGYIDCVLKHQLDHIHYKDIGIPDEWHQFILDNHKLGPVKVLTGALNSVIVRFPPNTKQYTYCFPIHWT